ncbi:MAG: response regulator [Chloroflexi bacterium]|nr:MAG: response regulator [Chloroflexota bacterium]
MSPIVFWLQQAVLVAFVLLGVAVGADWLRRRDRERGWLVLAIVLLAAMAGLSGLQPLLGGRLLSGAAVVAFIGSGYALFRFRAAFLPVPPRVARAVLAAAAAAAGLLLVLVLFSGRGPVAWPVVAAALGAFLVWALLVAEPSLRFWLAARDRPAVQRARLRALSAGFAGLLLLVVVSAAAGRAARTSLLEAVLQLLALAIVPLLYVSFAPPAWLRRQWRAREEEAFRAATQALLTAGSRKEVAELALDWAVRLVGAESGSIQDARGNLLAERGPATSGHVLEIPLAISDGQSRLTLVSGAFTPVFGQDERLRVEQYAITVAPALDRVTLVEQLRQANAELEEASRHKSKFLAGMSHELRTPLNAILGFSELLMDDGDTLTSSVRQNFLANIHTSGKHLLGLINDILDLAKVEAGQTELYLESVAVEGVARGVLDLLTPLADRKQIGLHLTEEPVSVVADHQKVKQMLINLVSNAIKFTPAGGRVDVSCRRRGQEVRIAVRDTGVGIAREDLPRVFEEFEQLEPPADQTAEGTGLGLALTKRFAELHGGWVEVRSQLGRGSTFTLHLPVEAAAPAARPRVPVAAGDGPLILVVEDNPHAADLLTTYLTRGGYSVEVANQGSSALELARRLRPDAITLDLLLPEVDGWDVLAALKHDPETADIPVVVVTVVDSPARGRALGAVDYLVKPVDPRTLLDCLEHRRLARRTNGEEVRVLVVDDDPLHHARLEGLLSSEGYAVIKAMGGREGIRKARELAPAVVILDLLMPDLSGLDVVAALKADPATAAIPILVMTAKELSREDKRVLNAQAAAVLEKPSVAGADLLGWLDELLNGQAPKPAPEVVAT